MTVKRVKLSELNEDELKQIAGGRFNFNTDYDMAMRAANIKCPACGAEGTLKSQIQGYDGYSDGRWALWTPVSAPAATARSTCIRN